MQHRGNRPKGSNEPHVLRETVLETEGLATGSMPRSNIGTFARVEPVVEDGGKFQWRSLFSGICGANDGSYQSCTERL